MRTICLILFSTLANLCFSACARPLVMMDAPTANNLVLFDGTTIAPIFVDTNSNEAVLRAVNDLAEDFARVTGTKAQIEKQISSHTTVQIIIGTLGESGWSVEG